MKHTEGFDDLIRYDLEMFDIKSRSTNPASTALALMGANS